MYCRHHIFRLDPTKKEVKCRIMPLCPEMGFPEEDSKDDICGRQLRPWIYGPWETFPLKYHSCD